MLEHGGYIRCEAAQFDPRTALDCDTLLTFLQETQPKKWEKIQTIHGAQAEDKVVSITFHFRSALEQAPKLFLVSGLARCARDPRGGGASTPQKGTQVAERAASRSSFHPGNPGSEDEGERISSLRS